MKIIFMGTPEFAVTCLNSLVNANHEISLVVTKPDMPVGRKQILTSPPIKTYALNNNCKVYQPSTLKSEEAHKIISDLKPDFIVVVAYGKILPKNILDIPKYGCINVHASLLPKFRVASPIQWSIVMGEKETGITTMLMDEGLDTGDILLTSKVKILDTDTAASLHDKLSVLGSDLIIKTIEGFSNGQIKPEKQLNENVSYAPIINKSMGLLDFNKTSIELNNLVRGFYPWPSCYFILDKRIKVFKTAIGPKTKKLPGEIEVINGKPFVACGDGYLLELLEICKEGSKKMSGSQAVNGRIL